MLRPLMAETAPSMTDRDVALSTPSLFKLVKLDLGAGEEKGFEDYVRAGRRLTILRERIPPGQWKKTLREKLDISTTTAARYMRYAERLDSLDHGSARRRAAPPPRTLSEGSGDHRPHHQAGWYTEARAQHAKATAHHASTPQREARWAEQRAVRTRATEIIDAGYRVVAAKYHPDKAGGSHAEMSRTNKARDGLRAALKFV